MCRAKLVLGTSPACAGLLRIALCLLSAALCHLQLLTRGCCMLGLSSAQGQSELSMVLSGCQCVPSPGLTALGCHSGTQEPGVPCYRGELSGVGALAPADAFSCSSSFCKQITQKIRDSFLGRIWQEALLCRLEKPAVSMALGSTPLSPTQGVWSSFCLLFSSSSGLCDVS